MHGFIQAQTFHIGPIQHAALFLIGHLVRGKHGLEGHKLCAGQRLGGFDQAVALTPAGREVMEKVRAARHDLITDAFAAWDDADRTQLAALLGRLADDFLRVERAT